MKLRPLCVVQTSDKAIKYFAAHEPIQAPTEQERESVGPKAAPLRMILNYEGTQVQLHFCKRCGVAYVEAHSISFADVPEGVTQAPGGNA